MAGSHAAKSSSLRPIVIVVVGLLIAGGAAALLASSRSSGGSSASPSSTSVPRELAVLASSPVNESTVDSSASIRIALNQPLSSTSPMPTISPAIDGSWQRLSASTIEFVQSKPLSPGQSVTVTVPGGPTGIRGASGARLANSTSSTFHVAPLSTLRVQQLLAELGYLPLSFSPAVAASGAGVATGDLAGSFTWRWSGLPDSLTSLWTPGQQNVITQGAVMRFQDVHSMTTDGQAGPDVWAALLADRSAGKVDPGPYNFVVVSRNLPESASFWSNGAVAFTTPVNTGIAASPTDVGTWPVYLRYRTQTMRGTNPDGSKYEDPGVPWVSYFYRGDALHGFIRPSYGSPQSLGCVEMTYAAAETVWPMTPIGTLVTVLP